MEAFETIPEVSRRDLEEAARIYFEKLRSEVDQPLHYSDYEFSDGVAHSIEMSKARIANLDDQLRAGEFEADVTTQAAALLANMPKCDADRAPADPRLVYELAARAERERLMFLVHRLTTPAKRYHSYDDVFSSSERRVAEKLDGADVTGPTLDRLADMYIASKRKLGRSKNQVEDTVRVLRWVSEQLGGDRLAAGVTKAELRRFRDDLVRRPKAGRGQSGRFADSLTDAPDDQVSDATALRYWGFISAFMAWAASEGHIPVNPASDIRLLTSGKSVQNSPEVFSAEELTAFLKSPIYSGHAKARRSTPGRIKARDGYWWSGLVLMHTGMRAGELAQLEPEDFVFSEEGSFIWVRQEGRSGKDAKAIKNASSKRRIPIVSVLLDLGLESFVSSRKHKDRVFYEFPFGSGRTSDGLSKFWGRYLKSINLWKDGRATHVWRHTLIANLRRVGVVDQDMAAVVGHSGTTMTSKYGGEHSPQRLQEIMRQLDFGIDVRALVNG